MYGTGMNDDKTDSGRCQPEREKRSRDICEDFEAGLGGVLAFPWNRGKPTGS